MTSAVTSAGSPLSTTTNEASAAVPMARITRLTAMAAATASPEACHQRRRAPEGPVARVEVEMSVSVVWVVWVVVVSMPAT